jgi:hypothetical protein
MKEENNPAGGGTLAVSRPFGATLWLALLFLFIIAAGAEIFFRSDFAVRHLPAPSYGIGHQNIDLKFAQMVELRRQGSLPECVLIGSSMIDTSINPDIFTQAFEENSGQEIGCYNFGIGGFNLPSAAKLVGSVVGMFDPEMIVLGISIYDLYEGIVRLSWEQSEVRFSQNAWLRYRLGEFSFEGWLTENSYAYRHFLRARQWMEWPEFSSRVAIKERSSEKGFNNFRGKKTFHLNRKKERLIRKKLKGFEVSPERIGALKEIAVAAGHRAVVFVEMPGYPAMKNYFPGGPRDYREAAEVVAAKARESGTHFIGLGEGELSGDELWRDYYHLNAEGARVFSSTLGERTGRALAPPPSR